jgi:hypothetical protein
MAKSAGISEGYIETIGVLEKEVVRDKPTMSRAELAYLKIKQRGEKARAIRDTTSF